jgi:hypothetical protein
MANELARQLRKRFTNADVSDTLDGVVLEVLAALGAVVKVE